MKFFNSIMSHFGTSKKVAQKTIEDYKREILVRQTRGEFEKLLKRGLSVPIALR